MNLRALIARALRIIYLVARRWYVQLDDAVYEHNRLCRRAYRERNHNKIKEKERAYREHNRDKLREGCRTHYRLNREKRLEEARAYRERNRDQINLRLRARRAAARTAKQESV